MIKLGAIILISFVLLVSVSSSSTYRELGRVKRFILPNWLWPFSTECGGPGDCPAHHCRLDPAVIQGYCCGCARVSDHVPINCPLHLTCPPSSQPLCSQYDYMMDCCC